MRQAGVAVQVSGDRLAAMLPAAAKKRLLVMSAFLRNDVHDVRRARLELHMWSSTHTHAHAHRQAGRCRLANAGWLTPPSATCLLL